MEQACELIEPDLSSESADWTDAEVCGKAVEWLLSSDELSCVHPLTISSHSPFDRVSGTMAGLYEDTPEEMRRYLTCIHYADSCIGVLLDRLEAEGMMDKTTVVITGDHIFFHSDKRNSYVPFAEKHGLPISHWNYYVPLIIYSPQERASVRVEEVCYQMDIYPTVLHAIDCASYAWKGLGVNLYEPQAVHQRTIGQNEAYILSDKLIRNNWFEHE